MSKSCLRRERRISWSIVSKGAERSKSKRIATVSSSRAVRISLSMLYAVFWHCCRLPFLGSIMTKDWVHGVGHSAVCCRRLSRERWLRLLHLLGPVLLRCCQLQLTSLSSTIAPQLLCEGWGGRPLCLSGDRSVLMDLHLPRDCTAQSSILSIGSVSLVLLWGIFLNDLSLVTQWSSLSRVGVPSCCCSSSNVLQSLHCFPIQYSFAFFMHLLMLLLTSLYFSDPSCLNLFFLSSLLSSHTTRVRTTRTIRRHKHNALGHSCIDGRPIPLLQCDVPWDVLFVICKDN